MSDSSDDDMDTGSEDFNEQYGTQVVDEIEILEGRMQTTAQINKRKRKLRELGEQIGEDNKAPLEVHADRLANQLYKENKYYGQGDNVGINVLDAKNMLTLTDTVYKISKKDRADANTFDINDFLEPLRIKLGLNLPSAADADAELDQDEVRRFGELGDWNKIGWLALKRTRSIIGVEFMNGMMAVEHKKRVIKKRARQAPLGAEVRPAELLEADMQSARNETVENTNAILRRLHQYEQNEIPDDYDGMNFFEFFINPQSFAQSVENLFYASFWVAQGKVIIHIDHEGIPRIYETPEPEEGEPQQDTGQVEDKKIQEILEFDQQVWVDAIEEFNITTSFLPDRRPRAAATGTENGWY